MRTCKVKWVNQIGEIGRFLLSLHDFAKSPLVYFINLALLWWDKGKSASEQDLFLKCVLSVSCLSVKTLCFRNIYFIIAKIIIAFVRSNDEYVRKTDGVITFIFPWWTSYKIRFNQNFVSEKKSLLLCKGSAVIQIPANNFIWSSLPKKLMVDNRFLLLTKSSS